MKTSKQQEPAATTTKEEEKPQRTAAELLPFIRLTSADDDGADVYLQGQAVTAVAANSRGVTIVYTASSQHRVAGTPDDVLDLLLRAR